MNENDPVYFIVTNEDGSCSYTEWTADTYIDILSKFSMDDISAFARTLAEIHDLPEVKR